MRRDGDKKVRRRGMISGMIIKLVGRKPQDRKDALAGLRGNYNATFRLVERS